MTVKGHALLDSAGRVIGAFDSFGNGTLSGLGAWRWVAHARKPAVVARDCDIDTTPRMQDVIKGWNRLR